LAFIIGACKFGKTATAKFRNFIQPLGVTSEIAMPFDMRGSSDPDSAPPLIHERRKQTPARSSVLKTKQHTLASQDEALPWTPRCG